MSVTGIRDWNDTSVLAVRSRGGVTAFPDYRDNLVRQPGCVWPPAEILQKLCRSDHLSAFLPDDQAALTQRLGYYCDLQSAHSEDAIQWSYFGPLVYGEEIKRIAFSNWLAEKLEVPFRNRRCTIALWRRIPHPDTLGSGGPELDLLIVGDAFAIVAESKWRSGEGRWQGSAGNQTQLQLRQQFLAKCGSRILETRELMVLYVVLDSSQEVLSAVQSPVPMFCLQWANLLEWEGHPRGAELQRYYEWKRNLVARPVGVPAPGRQIVSVGVQ